MLQADALWPSLILVTATFTIFIFIAIRVRILSKQTILLSRELSIMLNTVKKGLFKREILSEKQKLSERVVDKSSSTVQTVHKVVSDLTFDLIDTFPPTKKTSRIVRKVHDKTSSSVYKTVRSVNRQIGELSNEILKISPKKNTHQDTKKTADSRRNDQD